MYVLRLNSNTTSNQHSCTFNIFLLKDIHHLLTVQKLGQWCWVCSCLCHWSSCYRGWVLCKDPPTNENSHRVIINITANIDTLIINLLTINHQLTLWLRMCTEMGQILGKSLHVHVYLKVRIGVWILYIIIN